tara:strand:- start:2546 stop:2833 length:288 start_codon:yes stop_codon:yes gene_type:complete
MSNFNRYSITNILQIPRKLKVIQNLKNKNERKTALENLALELKLLPKKMQQATSTEIEWTKFYRKIYKDLINRILAIVGLGLIFASGFLAVWRSL